MPVQMKETTVKGRLIQVTQFGAMTAMRLAIRISKIAGPGIAEIFDKKGSADGVDKRNVSLAAVAAKVVDRLDEVDGSRLLLDLLSQTHVDRRDVSDETTFNDVFTGRLADLFPIIRFVIEVNYKDFFGMLQAGDTGAEPLPGSSET